MCAIANTINPKRLYSKLEDNSKAAIKNNIVPSHLMLFSNLITCRSQAL